MHGKITLKAAGIIAGAAAIFAFLFGIIISVNLPGLTNRSEASSESTISPPLVNEEGDSPFAQVADLVMPSVVNISAERTVSGRMPGFEWHFEGPFEDFFKDFFKGLPKYEGKTQTLGSGFLISDDGYLITNYHVIKGASDIVIKLTDKTEYKGAAVKIIGVDPRTDVALLKIDVKTRLPFLRFGDSDRVKVGDWAIAFGAPFHLEGTVTVGVISAKGRTGIALPEGPDFQNFLQTDAAINPGNSGGPLVDIHGEVIGINTAITSPTGGNVGIGFAIPINLAKQVIEELRTSGKVTRGYLGVYLQDITEDLRKALGLPSADGALISEVMENSPASKAGLKNGDVVIEFDGQRVTDVASFRLKVAATKVGKNVKMKILRDGKEKTINVTIGEFVEESTAAQPGETTDQELGIDVVNINDPQAQRFDLKVKQGVVIVGIQPDSPAYESGIEVGDVLLAIENEEIKSLNDYRKVVKKLEKGKPAIFHIQRGERKHYVAVTL